MTSTGTILVAIDGSKNSIIAAGAAAQMAKMLGAHLGLLHVLDSPPFAFWAGVQEQMKDDIRHQAEATLKDISEKISAACNIIPEFYLIDGVPEEEILRVVNQDEKILMVVIGRAGIATEKKAHPGLRKASGRLGTRLSELLPIPVVIVPPDISPNRICPAMVLEAGDSDKTSTNQ
jgi:nucleotide-binding universal stress UspA family protein